MEVVSHILCTSLLSVLSRRFQVLTEPQLLGNVFVGSVIITNGCGNFREVVDPLSRNDALTLPHLVHRLAGFKTDQSGDLLP